MQGEMVAAVDVQQLGDGAEVHHAPRAVHQGDESADATGAQALANTHERTRTHTCVHTSQPCGCSDDDGAALAVLDAQVAAAQVLRPQHHCLATHVAQLGAPATRTAAKTGLARGDANGRRPQHQELRVARTRATPWHRGGGCQPDPRRAWGDPETSKWTDEPRREVSTGARGRQTRVSKREKPE